MSKSLAFLFLLLLFLSGDTEIKMSRLSTVEFEESNPIFFQNGILFASNELNEDNAGSSKLTRMLFCEFDNSSEEFDSFKDPIVLTVATGKFKFHNAPGDYLESTKELYFTTNNRKSDEDYFLHLSIAKGKVKGIEIDAIEHLNINNPNYSVAHPTLSEDGQTMMVASDKDGDFDLYQYSRNHDDNWKLERKLIELENDFDEILPNLINDTTLIFSSDHYLGKGGFDLYITTKNSTGIWNTPINLDELNSDVDDFSYLPIDAKSGYISSNRQNDNGDIFYFNKLDK